LVKTCDESFNSSSETSTESSSPELTLTTSSNHNALLGQLVKKPFKSPLLGNSHPRPPTTKTLGIQKIGEKIALHDPNADNALILYSPAAQSHSEKLLKSKKIDCHVVVDPLLGNVLRPHQREGVKFMYDAATGVKSSEDININGCIMADEMGLGKTLQCVALAWTMLTQSPQISPPLIKSVLIVCPSSLVKNWQAEFKKWLGGRVQCCAISESGKENVESKLKNFTAQMVGRASEQVLISSYETLRGHVDLVKNSKFGMMICDEGHRLKNCDSLTYKALMGLKTQMRILLSGTPIQNDLSEFYSLMNFVNPKIFGELLDFKKKYENPIEKSREPGCKETIRLAGQECLKNLLEISSKCIIRRTQSLLTKYLPVKFEHIVLCKMSDEQQKLYSKINAKFLSKIDDNMRGALATITDLKKICNHPCLLQSNDQPSAKKPSKAFSHQKSNSTNLEISGKLALLDIMLYVIKKTTDDKVVLISNYTQTIDLFEQMCRLRGYKFVRLDGSLSTKKRQKLVDELNAPNSPIFAFMLSSKAGGCGLNLIGANRLFMFDPDWNPANDEQAMARIWRDGQKKPCYIYRLLASGTIEERMLQRQMRKIELSDCVIDSLDTLESTSSSEELRALFEYDFETSSYLHAQLKCHRCVKNVQSIAPPEQATCKDNLSDWHHCFQAKNFTDDRILRKAFESNNISMVFYQKSHEQIKTI